MVSRIATPNEIVEILTFMKPLIRLRRNPYVRKPVRTHIKRVRRKQNTDNRTDCVSFSCRRI